jgi:polyhydroxybutyrate depolymerase
MKNILLVILCTSFGFSMALAQSPIAKRDSFKIEGYTRTFNFLEPLRKDAALVFVMHGSGGNGLEMKSRSTKLVELSASENILIVYPDGYKRYWNECRKTANSEANHLDINENAFFAQMIDYFVNKYKINPKKVYAVGTSGGGHMAYKLALTMPERFKAVVALIANLPTSENLDCQLKSLAVPVMIVNGTEDKINPYAGGEVITGPISLGMVRSTDATFAYWSGLAGYRGTPKEILLPDTDPKDGKTIVQYTHKKRKKPEVTLLKVIGGGHNYPGDIDVHLAAWQFFQRQ